MSRWGVCDGRKHIQDVVSVFSSCSPSISQSASLNLACIHFSWSLLTTYGISILPANPWFWPSVKFHTFNMPTQWLTEVPREIRNMIYHEVFRGLQVLLLGWMQAIQSKDKNRFTGFSLFLTSKQVYEDCRPIFWRTAIFGFHSYGFTAHTQTEMIKSKIHELRNMERMFCRDIEYVHLVLASKSLVSIDTTFSSPPAQLKEIYFERDLIIRTRNGRLLSPGDQYWNGPVCEFFDELRGILSHLKCTRIHCTLKGFQFHDLVFLSG